MKNQSGILDLAISAKYWPELQRTIDNWNDNQDGDYERLVERSANLWHLAGLVIEDYSAEQGLSFSDEENKSLCHLIENFMELWLMVYDKTISANFVDERISESVALFSESQ